MFKRFYWGVPLNNCDYTAVLCCSPAKSFFFSAIFCDSYYFGLISGKDGLHSKKRGKKHTEHTDPAAEKLALPPGASYI